MKTFLPFLIVYIIVVSALYTFYLSISNDIQERILKNEKQIKGIDYLQSIDFLSVKVGIYEGESKLGGELNNLQEEITKEIDKIFSLQAKYPEFKNSKFNNKLRMIQSFDLTSDEYYEFLEDVNHENYKVGDISELLFESERKINFSLSLMTHYLPEYLISTIIAHNIVEELIYKGTLSDARRDLFLEQTKLIYLSAKEVDGIVKLVNQYPDSKLMVKYTKEIVEGLQDLSKEIDLKKILQNDVKTLHRYIALTHPIMDNSYKLNEENGKITLKYLQERTVFLDEKKYLIHKISLFILFIISFLFIVSYRLYVLKVQKTRILEEEKEKTQAALDFKSKFLSNMSHEIRTPLNSIIGLTHVVMKTSLNEKQTDIMDKIQSSSELLLGVINDILDISKIEAAKMNIEEVEFDLKHTLEMIQDMFSDRIEEKSLNFNVDYTNMQNFHFIGDSLRISQVLTNLLSNAVKFTSKGTISLIVQDKGDNNISFEVKDTGIGLKRDQIDSLFEDFVQADMDTSRKFGGTGLGLSISKNLVNLMGGDIHIKSEYQKGSNFSFVLSLQPSKNLSFKDNTEETLDALEERVNSIENFSILVAEDNMMNQMLLKMLLEDTKLELDFANDGAISVDMFEKKNYDLILMDIQMPNMNGYEATAIIRKKNKDIPIIALSANIMESDIKKAYDIGVNGYLSKPIEVEKLYQELLKYVN